MQTQQTLPAYLGKAPEDYQRLGLSPERIAAWEDGMHTDGTPGNYEWWYFDAQLADGSKLVTTFFTKPYQSPQLPLTPMVRCIISTPDGRNIEKTYYGDAQTFSAARDHCDVRIGKSTFKGDLHTYQIHVEIDEVVADLAITGKVPSWRPGTGYSFYEARQEAYIAWLVAVPLGEVQASITLDGQTSHSRGDCYHDHNWGNTPMQQLVHHWYWARAQVGEYSLITAYIIGERAYGYLPITEFLLTKNSKIVADDERHVTFHESERVTDKDTGKPISNVMQFVYQDQTQHYVIIYKRERDIRRERLVEIMPPTQRAEAEHVGFDGVYYRFTGPCTLERFSGNKLAHA